MRTIFLPLLLFIAATSANPGSSGSSDCKSWCSDKGKSCFSDSEKGYGQCFDCGPRKNNKYKQWCGGRNGKCCDTYKDNDHCGKCDNKCKDGKRCDKSECKKP
ncbi:hypothetical protein W97_05336 [Coniosporium apollinis CBS 100218]|uniref:TNFR-Cys domain-containing protein n=1 Tax=Coniosporium apollinis (strain CBS 100218) TaxID=1168221 RepID=R7YW95_CONA1|nr:uncharacterized protein W97_05336 [Coniosporium apollinis CBS 100218]EON66093.1 hypothetical protein W97_05336 [Coniosporium apollinis CBS 100218]